MSRKPIVGGNWKCNGSRESIKELCETIKNGKPKTDKVDVVVFPTAIYLDYTQSLLNGTVEVGAQNCWPEAGAFTGEISAAMIKDSGFAWTILGHSERRHTVAHESEEILGKKLRAALDAQLNVIYCIGELDAERSANKTRDVVFTQLKTLAEIVNGSEWSRVVIAYEPVWAIGTGKVATPEIAQETHGWIRGWLSENVSAEVAEAMRIQYGGSVKGSNAAELGKQPDIDGFLVGGASLKPDFLNIIAAFD